MTYDNDDLTDPQRQAISEAENAILQILADTRTKLAEAGMDLPAAEEGDFSCTRCSCEFFMSGSTPGLACKRSGCGHSFTLHRVR
jgi:hypothetical protein